MKLLVILITMLSCLIQENIATLYETNTKSNIECVQKVDTILGSQKIT